MIITPAEGLAFLISAITENLFSLILFSIFSLKLINVLLVLINSFNDSSEIVFLNLLFFQFSF